ncbi:pyridoxal phosphate phosphatase PHOSPHO2 [Alosa sapidissima]|uniref:pyridoxal phosphate phosphatase PHOSPHO2 n=1 Tax=Alosa sapidissima TaxID=34773 RepID=UPI001C09B90B|nr:pyridoxal phosphate phosphatase PHOSPHO2 [Alosa sapidissima]
MKTLMVFDFDHTIVDENCDTWVIRSTPDKRLPDWLAKTYQKGRWTEYMGRVMSYIGDQGVTSESIRSVMHTIPFTDGMVELFTFISGHKNDIDCIIVSDANMVFIDWILEGAGLRQAFDKVFSNPASVDSRGYVTVQCYHSHTCAKCPINMCKRKILEDFIATQDKMGVQYARTIYVGDGGNDLCPLKAMREEDIAMPRKGYTLERLVLAGVVTEDGTPLKPRVLVWTSATEILNELKAVMQ